MHKVKIMDVNHEQEYMDKKNNNKKNGKIIKIEDSLFEIGLRKGLIEKFKNEYFFIGDLEELIAFTNKRPSETLEWFD